MFMRYYPKQQKYVRKIMQPPSDRGKKHFWGIQYGGYGFHQSEDIKQYKKNKKRFSYHLLDSRSNNIKKTQEFKARNSPIKFKQYELCSSQISIKINPISQEHSSIEKQNNTRSKMPSSIGSPIMPQQVKLPKITFRIPSEKSQPKSKAIGKIFKSKKTLDKQLEAQNFQYQSSRRHRREKTLPETISYQKKKP